MVINDDTRRLLAFLNNKSYQINAKINLISAENDITDIGLNAKIDSTNTSLNSKIDSTNTSLNSKIDSINTSLDAKINSINTSLDAKINSINTSLDAKINSTNNNSTNNNSIFINWTQFESSSPGVSVFSGTFNGYYYQFLNLTNTQN